MRDLEALGQGTNKDQSLRLNININNLRSFNAKETNNIIKRPMHYIVAFQEAALEVPLAQSCLQNTLIHYI